MVPAGLEEAIQSALFFITDDIQLKNFNIEELLVYTE